MKTKTFAFHVNHVLIANLIAALRLFVISCPELFDRVSTEIVA